MSRYHPRWSIEPTLSAADYWKSSALSGEGSVFGGGSVWSDTNVDALNEFFVENLDYGEGNFISKLKSQLEPAPPDAKKLAAEMLWFMLLCPSNIGAENKRQTVFTVWDWSGAERPLADPWLRDDVLRGVGSAGTAFNTHRWRELVFFIRFMRSFRSLELSQRDSLLSDGWALAEWMQTVPEADTRQLRHMILFLLFPDEFERIFGRSDRRRLLLAFSDLTKPQIAALSALEISREIQRIRRREEERHQTTQLDFYESPLVEQWKSERDDESPPPEPEASPFRDATAGIRREHVLEALAEIDRDHYPPDARSSTYDLIHGSSRYPPKYVLSLAAKYATGRELPRQFFSGGKDSQAFKLLKDLGFHIEVKELLRDLIRAFIAQADESSTLAVADYPKEYRGLKVNVSFGKGNFAKVPWISFTGYDQTTSDGIYPLLLYYRTAQVLIVSYGISETHPPRIPWDGIEEAPTVAHHFQDLFGTTPERYGNCKVRQAFTLADSELDLAGIEGSLDQVIGAYHKQFETEAPGQLPEVPPTLYGPEEALSGLFIDEAIFDEALSLLRQKKNLILQGPPGVGKTFVSKRLAYALIGEKSEKHVGMVQFHQSYAYEDFIQGYRPAGTGGFRLKNGIFYEFCETAKQDPAGYYVFIIDEINRGNLSKVFGELMLLVEADKRGPEWAIPLTYSENTEDRFYIPGNVYLIGLMNTADRSLAMVDYALRRRFAFVDIPPGFDTEEFREFLVDHGADPAFVEEIIVRFEHLNTKISEDAANLGPGYRIGHSYFCSIPEGVPADWNWYVQIVKTEIAPLLREYYFDDEKQAASLIEGLMRPI